MKNPFKELTRTGLSYTHTHIHTSFKQAHVPELGRAARATSEERKRPLARRMGRRGAVCGYVCICMHTASDRERERGEDRRWQRQADNKTETYP